MQADRYGTPAEQARNLVAWHSPLAANAARSVGKIDVKHRCASCCHYRSHGAGAVCTIGIMVIAFSTSPNSWCAKWYQAPTFPAEKTSAQDDTNGT